MSRVSTLLLLAALLVPTAASAHSHKAKGLVIVHPWTRAMPDNAASTVIVSMTIKNVGRAAERLLGASTALAGRVEIRMPGGAAKQANAITIPAGKEVFLKRDGAHLLLSGVKRRLEAHESFAMTLEFEKAGQVVIEVVVEELEEAPKPR